MVSVISAPTGKAVPPSPPTSAAARRGSRILARHKSKAIAPRRSRSAPRISGRSKSWRRPVRANPCAVLEVPLSTVRVAGRNLPASGGGFFRLLPYGVSRAAFRRVNRIENRPAIFYMHPWEIDAAQPRFAGLSAKSRFRHYLNLGRMYGRLERLLGDFAWD